MGATSPKLLHAAPSLSAPSGNSLSGRKVGCTRPATTMMLAIPTYNLSALRGWDSPVNTASALRLQKAMQKVGRNVFGIYFPALTSRPVRENKKPNAACCPDEHGLSISQFD